MYGVIKTKYLGPTNTRGSRVKATSAQGQSVILPWDDRCNSQENHNRAAMTLAQKMRWKGRWLGGADRDCGCVWVCDASSYNVHGVFTVVVTGPSWSVGQYSMLWPRT